MITLGKLVGPGSLQTPEFDRLADERELESHRKALLGELAVHGGLVGLAREIGVGRIVLRKFLIHYSKPAEKNLAKIREWAANRPPAFAPFGSVLLRTLVSELPPELRGRARAEVADVLAMNFQRAGTIPDWLRLELGMDPRRSPI